MTMITPSYLGETIEYSSLHACRSTLEDPTLLILQRGSGGLWDGFWEFPTIHIEGADPAARSFGTSVDLAEGVRRLTGVRAQIGPVFRTVRYSVTNHRVLLDAYEASALSIDLRPADGYSNVLWESPENLIRYPFGAAGRRLAAGLVKDLAKDDPCDPSA